jgi:hypothetical protein
MWHQGTPLRSSPKSGVRLYKLAKHSNKTIAKKRKRAAHQCTQREPAYPPLSQWRHRANPQDTTPHKPTSPIQSPPPRETVPGANERTQPPNTVHTENRRKRHHTRITDPLPLIPREQEQGASGAPSPPARPNRKRPTLPQMTTQGLVASGASSPLTGKRRRIQQLHCADSPLPQERGVNEAPTPLADPSRTYTAHHQTSTQEMEASGASSLSFANGQRCHTNPYNAHNQHYFRLV